MARERYVIIPQDDFESLNSLIHDIKINISKFEHSYFVSEVSRKVDEMEQILNDERNED